MLLDIPTLASIAVTSNLVFAACAYGAWRHMPEEPCLRAWATGIALLGLGALELVLRTPASGIWSIPVGNGLLAMGHAWLLIAQRRLVNRPKRHWELWLGWSAFFTLALPCAWYTNAHPSLTIRIIVVSLTLAAWHVSYAWTLSKHQDHQLTGWLRLTIGLQLLAVALYVNRALFAPIAYVSPDYVKTSMAIAAPGFYAMLFNIWMTITLVLLITTRMHDRVVETLGFNREILANSPLATAVYRADGSCVLVNGAYVELMEQPREQLLQHNFRHPGPWRESGMHQACLQALHSRQRTRCEFHTTTASGRAIWLDCRLHPSSIQGETHLLLQFSDLTERKCLEDQLRQMAFHDPLTMLPNRRLLMDRIRQAQHASAREQQHAALLFIDLDKFKQLNDHHGHGVGDRFLIALAKQLTSLVRKTDSIARLGGDEFVLMLENLAADAEQAMAQAHDMAAVIRQAIERNDLLPDIAYQMSASIGIHLFRGTEVDPAKLLDHADLAMYQVKGRRASASVG